MAHIRSCQLEDAYCCVCVQKVCLNCFMLYYVGFISLEVFLLFLFSLVSDLHSQLGWKCD